MVRDADAVLVVLLQTDVTERQFALPFFRSRTIYAFHVLNVIKGSVRLGDVVRVARQGGRHTYEDNFPRPGVGEKFVVFLKWSPEVGAYRHLFGPLTTFRVVNGRIHPVGVLFGNQLGRSADEFLRDLQALVARQQGG